MIRLNVIQVALLIIFVFFIIPLIILIISTNKNSTRDYQYEAYCDSIYQNDNNYYNDVLVESEEFQQYIEQNGIWWK